MKCKCCDGTKRLAIKNPPTCIKCYCKKNRKRYKCSNCDNIIHSGKFCQKCKNYKRPQEKCSNCGQMKEVIYREKENILCRNCYNLLIRIKYICKNCGELKIINGNGFCKLCYKTKIELCYICNKNKNIHTKKENKYICKDCYNLWKKSVDSSFAILYRLRIRVRDAFKNFSKTGKIRKADEYGIEYDKIIKHLGLCPGNLKDYHIDHIKPLCLFDFNDLEQIKQAFAPENHQWLTKEENLKKSSTYEEK